MLWRRRLGRAALLAAITAVVVIPGGGAAPGRASPAGKPVNFLTGPQRGEPLEIALAYIRAHRQELGLTARDLTDFVVTDNYVSRHTGVTHIYLRQRHGGIEVFDGNINANVARNGAVINLGSSFVGDLAGKVDGSAPARDRVQAVVDAARGLGLRPTEAVAVIQDRDGPAQKAVLSDGGVSLAPIPAALVYQRVGTDALRLAWNLEIQELSGQHWWSVRVDAQTGELLERHDLVDHDNAQATAAAVARPSGAQESAVRATRAAADGSSYRVFPIPTESPSHGGRELVTDPAEPTASPFGWHDTNGVDGPEFTITRGNNVHTYSDRIADNAPDAGSEPNGGPGLDFDFALDLTKDPSEYQPAAVTNTFYWSNINHDVFYGYGFDEPAGNFQSSNYGKGGLGNDYLLAEAQDGSGVNNANFATPVDGSRPRMQMFLWTPPVLPNVVVVNPPSPLAGSSYQASTALFGPPLTPVGVTGDVALVNDGAGANSSDGCELPVGFSAGKIAILDRGNCTFGLKVKNAQTAGASAAIVVNNVPGLPINMSGQDADAAQVVISSVMVSLADGTALKDNLPLNATIKNAAGEGGVPPNRDGDLDSGVITHEYGHGISNRLTGGPNNVSCLQHQEREGEGWSDWFALVLTASAGDGPTTHRGIGTYVLYESPEGNGIRPTRYSTDMTVNPSTYDTIKTAAVPHGVGYVWATMLWEVYWNLVQKYGFNPNVYEDWTTAGNNLAIQLVMDGLKLQVCSPGFVDSRNAILLAEQALTGGRNQCEIWKGFAKRGLGVSANQGSPTSTTDGTQAFDLPVECQWVFTGFFGLKSPPAINKVGAGKTVDAVFSLGGDFGLDIFVAGSPETRQLNCQTKEPIGSPEPATGTLRFDPEGSATDRYIYSWPTSVAWKKSCRQLVVTFKGGAVERQLNFKFRR